MHRGKAFTDIFGGELSVGVRSATCSGRERAVWVGEHPLDPVEARRLATWLRTCAGTAGNSDQLFVVDTTARDFEDPSSSP